MAALPEPLAALVAALNRLPGIGPRSAERLALHLVLNDPLEARQLADAIVQARDRVRACPVCGGLTEKTPCAICDDPRRDPSVVCVVERAVDILSLEKTSAFPGKYHVLGGKISPLDGVGPQDLRVAELERRLGTEPIRELVLALPTDVEGDATSYFLSQRMASDKVKVTRIAYGLPVGSGLEFADQLTLKRALEGRRELT